MTDCYQLWADRAIVHDGRAAIDEESLPMAAIRPLAADDEPGVTAADHVQAPLHRTAW